MAYKRRTPDAEPLALSQHPTKTPHSAGQVTTMSRQNDTWADGHPLPEPRVDCQAAITHTGDVIVLGGGPPLRRVAGRWGELPASYVDAWSSASAGSIVLA